MFWDMFVARHKCLTRDKTLLFWTILFPVVLATMMYFAFGNLMAGETMQAIPVAVVEEVTTERNEIFLSAIREAGSESGKPLFDLASVEAEEANSLLEEKKVDAVVTVGNTLSMKVKENGLNQSVVKSFLDQYIQTEHMIETVIEKNPAMLSALQEGSFQNRSFTKEISLGGAEPNLMLSYFYALLAMACLYGSFWGLKNMTDIQANLTDLGARRSIVPVKKWKVALSDAMASMVIQTLELLLLLAFLVLALKVDFGNQIGLVVFTCVVGSIMGISFGSLVGAASRISEGLKIGILIGISLACSFLAGLMFVNMKDIIAQNVPILSYINPAALLSDAFYSLYMFGAGPRYWINIAVLAGITVLFSGISYLKVRRQRYASL